MYGDTCYELANHQIRHQTTHKVGCPPGDCIYGHFNLPWGIVWVCMSPHTHFIPPPTPSKGTDDTSDETHIKLLY